MLSVTIADNVSTAKKVIPLVTRTTFGILSGFAKFGEFSKIHLEKIVMEVNLCIFVSSTFCP